MQCNRMQCSGFRSRVQALPRAWGCTGISPRKRYQSPPSHSPSSPHLLFPTFPCPPPFIPPFPLLLSTPSDISPISLPLLIPPHLPLFISPSPLLIFPFCFPHHISLVLLGRDISLPPFLPLSSHSPFLPFNSLLFHRFPISSFLTPPPPRVPKAPSARRHCRPESFCASGKFLRVCTKFTLKSSQNIV